MAKIQSHNYYEGTEKNGEVSRDLHVNIDVEDYAEASSILSYLRSYPGFAIAALVQEMKSYIPPTATEVPAPKTDLQVAPEVVAAPTEPPRIVVPPVPVPAVAPPAPTPEKVHVSPEVERQDLIDSVSFLFEEDCKDIRSIENAVKVWKDHAGAIKKLQEADKLRCSNTIALRLAEVLGVEPQEAKEVLKAALTKKSEPPAGATPAVPKAIQPAPVKVPPLAGVPVTMEYVAPETEAPAAPPVPAKVGDAPAPAETPSGAAESVLGALASEPKPLLGLAVKHACTYLKTDQGVHAKLVEDLLVSMIGKHPVLSVPEEDIYKITRGAAMKLYAGAAKTKLL